MDDWFSFISVLLLTAVNAYALWYNNRWSTRLFEREKLVANKEFVLAIVHLHQSSERKYQGDGRDSTH